MDEWRRRVGGWELPSVGDPDPVMAEAPCPVWCDYAVNGEVHTIVAREDERVHTSDAARLRMTLHNGMKNENVVALAQAQVEVRQLVAEAEPTITVRRCAGTAEGGYAVMKGSRYDLTIAEAAELAHILLAAVDLALEQGVAEPAVPATPLRAAVAR